MHPSQQERVARATWALLVGFEHSRAGCNCWRNCVYCVSSIFLCGEFGCAWLCYVLYASSMEVTATNILC